MPGINFDHPSSDISADSGTMKIDGAAAFTAADKSELDGIATGAEVNPPLISQVEAEAGTDTNERTTSALRMKQAIAALETGGGALNFIASVTASNSATVEFTSGIDATYDRYEIHIIDLIPATDDVLLYLRTDSNGGASFDAGGTDYKYTLVGNDGTAWDTTFAGSAAFIQLNHGASAPLGNATGENSAYTITLNNPAGTAVYPNIGWTAHILNKNAAHSSISLGNGHRQAVATIDAVQFLLSSGNIASGEFYLYGISKS